MKIKLFSSLYLMVFSLSVQAAPVQITDLRLTSMSVITNFNGNFLQLGTTYLTDQNLVAGYISDIAITDLIMPVAGSQQTIYTAASNTNPYSNGPAAGSFAGGPVPSGTVDSDTGFINVDMSGLFASHYVNVAVPFSMDQNMGGIANGLWNPQTNEFAMSWVSALSQGPEAPGFVTWNVTGIATTFVPLPASLWLLATSLIGLLSLGRKAA